MSTWLFSFFSGIRVKLSDTDFGDEFMKTSGFRGFIYAAAISIIVFILILATNADVGVTWDEPAYIAASESYNSWFQQVFTQPKIAFSEKIITNDWQVNSEHPPLDKIWSGAVWAVARNFTDDLTAHRMGNMLLASILAGLLFLWIREAYGMAAGLAAVGALLTMPRFFFHAHLSALDVPAAFSVFVTTFLFWKVLERKRWTWGLLLGLVWGLALATKINAVFVPITLGLWLLCFRRELRLFVRLVLMGLTAIPVFFAVWPWLYHQTLERVITYIGFVTTNHWQIGQFYLGKFYLPPPWHFGFVMTWAVLPLGLTVLSLVGIIRAGRWKQNKGLGFLLFLSALTPILAISTGKSMVYDNDRLIMVAFPFLAALAGAGFGWLVSGWRKLTARVSSGVVRHGGVIILIALAFVPQLVTMVRLYPHYLSYYGEGVGGLAGATRLGLETTYWCETYQLALPILNEQAKPGDRIWADPWSHDVLIYYQVTGKLRKDLVITNEMDAASVLGADAPMARRVPMSSADWFLFEHRQTTLGTQGLNSPIMSVLNRQEVVYEYKYDGVPIFTLYR